MGIARVAVIIRASCRCTTSAKPASVPYYIMPYVEGDSLVRAPATGKAAPPIAEAIPASPRHCRGPRIRRTPRGVLHRDVKPENILLAEQGCLSRTSGWRGPSVPPTNSKLTETGVIVGTVFYMSPEQLREPGTWTSGPTSTAWDAFSSRC